MTYCPGAGSKPLKPAPPSQDPYFSSTLDYRAHSIPWPGVLRRLLCARQQGPGGGATAHLLLAPGSTSHLQTHRRGSKSCARRAEWPLRAGCHKVPCSPRQPREKVWLVWGIRECCPDPLESWHSLATWPPSCVLCYHPRMPFFSPCEKHLPACPLNSQSPRPFPRLTPRGASARGALKPHKVMSTHHLPGWTGTSLKAEDKTGRTHMGPGLRVVRGAGAPDVH